MTRQRAVQSSSSLARSRDRAHLPAIGFVLIAALPLASVLLFLFWWEIRHLPATILLLAGLLLAWVCGPLLARVLQGKLDLFEPSVIFILAYALYTLSPTLSFQLQGVPFSQATYVRSLSLYLVGAIAFWMGYYCIRTRSLPLQRILPDRLDSRRTGFAGLILIGVGMLLLLYILQSLGGISMLRGVAYGQRRLLFSQGDVPWFAVTYLVNLGLLAFGYAVFHLKRKRLWVILACFFIPYVLILFLLGRRLPFVLAFLPLVTLFHYRVRAISVLRGGVMFVALALLLLVVARTRNISQTVSLAEHLRSNASADWVDPGQSEFTGAAVITLTLLDAVPSSYPFKLGETYLQSIAILIPQFLYPDRPEPLNVWLSKTFFPRAYSRGGGLAGSLVGESYLNFGFVGTFLVLFLIGAGCRSLATAAQNSRSSAGAAMLYASLMPWFLIAMRAPFASLLKGYVFLQFVPLVILLWFCAERSRSDENRRGPSPERNVASHG